MNGWLNIDKPKGITAHDVVNIVRKLTKTKQVGHAGTLDPMATGVLLVALGNACRAIRFLKDDKVYSASVLLGKQTTTDDIEGETIRTLADLPSEDKIVKALLQFTGKINQIPPQFSAIKVQGKRLYKLARQGIKVENLSPREVNIYKLEVLNINLPVVKILIHCSSGTYIRAIARDLGNILGCGGCLSELRRLRLGDFVIENTLTIEELEKLSQNNTWKDKLINMASALPLPQIKLEEEQVRKLQHGQKLSLESSYPYKSDEYVLAMSEQDAIAVCHVIDSCDQTTTDKVRLQLKPEVVFRCG